MHDLWRTMDYQGKNIVFIFLNFNLTSLKIYNDVLPVIVTMPQTHTTIFKIYLYMLLTKTTN